MLKILLITDKKAGHESISNGLVKAIGERRDIETTKIYSKIRAKFIKKIATVLLKKSTIKRENIPYLIKLFYKDFSMDLNQKYDLIISTGGDTSFLNILLAKYFDTPNIYCSSLRGLKSNYFTYIVSIVDNHIKNEIVVDFPPVHVEIKEKELSGKYLAVLIGGATKNYKFSDDEFIDIVKNSIKLAKKMGYKILLTTSRRTPIQIEKKIKALCEKDSNIFEMSIFFNEKPQKVVNYFLSNADAVLCTQESGSMITESILAKKRLYTIRAKEIKLNRIYELFMQNITKKGYIYSVLAKDIDGLTLKEEFNHIDDIPSRKVVDKILKRIDS